MEAAEAVQLQPPGLVVVEPEGTPHSVPAVPEPVLHHLHTLRGGLASKDPYSNIRHFQQGEGPSRTNLYSYQPCFQIVLFAWWWLLL